MSTKLITAALTLGVIATCWWWSGAAGNRVSDQPTSVEHSRDERTNPVHAALEPRREKPIPEKLADDARIHGVVIDPAGKPMESAVVVAWADAPCGALASHLPAQERWTVLATTRTDGNGLFAIDPGDVDLCSVRVTHESVPPLLRVDCARSSFQRFEMVDGATVHGTVLTKELTPDPDARIRVRIGGEVSEARTDDSGQYELTRLRPGRVTVQVMSTSGGEPRPATVELEPGDRIRQDFVLREELVLIGRVTDRSTRKPIVGATVEALHAGYQTTVTDASGRFRLGQFGPKIGRSVRVVADGYATRTLLVICLDDIDPVHVELDPLGPWIYGQLVDGDGRPLPDAHVGLFRSQLFRSQSMDHGRTPSSRLAARTTAMLTHLTRTDPAGCFALRQFDGNNPALLLFAKQTFGTQWRTVTPNEHDHDEGSDLGVFVLEPQCRVRCQLVDGEGSPVSGLEVCLVPLGLEDVLTDLNLSRMDSSPARLVRESKTTDEDGIVEFVGLTPGPYRVELVDDRFLATRELFVATPGDSVEVTLEVELGLTIHGAVVDANGTRLEGIRVSLRAEEESRRFLRPVRADARGEFVFVGLSAGYYSLRAISPSKGEVADAKQNGIRAGAGGPAVVLTLSPNTLLYGIVVNSSSEPVANAWLLLFDRPDDPYARPAGQAASDDRGQFQFSVGGGGTYRILVWPSLDDLKDVRDGETLESLYECPNRVELRGISASDSPVTVHLHD